MPEYTRLSGIRNVGDATVITQINQNLMEYFDWSLLEARGFQDVRIGDYGDTLYPVQLPGTTTGKIWQTQYPNWTHESGLESGNDPIQHSGIYVNGVFYGSETTGVYKHYADYRQGRIVFDSPVAATSVIKAEYSHKLVALHDADVPWFRQVVLNDFITDQNPTGTGLVSLLNDYRVKLPAVILEPVPTRRMEGKQLGDYSQWVHQHVLFHILAESVSERNFLVDAITLQKDRTIYLYDVNERAASNDMALDWRGAKVSGASMYPTLVQPDPTGYRYNKCFFEEMTPSPVDTRLPFFRAVVRAIVLIDFTG